MITGTFLQWMTLSLWTFFFSPKHIDGRVLCEYLPSGCVLVVSGDLDLRLHAPPAPRAVSASLSGGEKFKTLHQQKPLLWPSHFGYITARRCRRLTNTKPPTDTHMLARWVAMMQGNCWWNLFRYYLKNIGQFFFDVLYISLVIYNRTDTWPTNPQLQYLTTRKTLSYIFLSFNVSLIHLWKNKNKRKCKFSRWLDEPSV